MPNYSFRCSACESVYEDIQLPISERNGPVSEPCPSCSREGTIERVYGAPFIGDSIRQGRMNLPSSWTDKLADIKSKHIRSTIKIPSPARRET